MNTVKPPECWSTDPNARALCVEVSPGNSLLLPYDQFIYAELHSDATEQRLRLVFSTHEVIVRGPALRRTETAIQWMELSHLACLPASCGRLVTGGQPFICEIAVVESKEAI